MNKSILFGIIALMLIGSVNARIIYPDYPHKKELVPESSMWLYNGTPIGEILKSGNWSGEELICTLNTTFTFNFTERTPSIWTFENSGKLINWTDGTTKITQRQTLNKYGCKFTGISKSGLKQWDCR